MEQHTYENELDSELAKHTDITAIKIQKVVDSLPEKAVQLNIEIFPSQEGDGMFSIRVNLDGPDLYILNKEIENISAIFNPKFVELEIAPYVPTVDQFEINYEINDVIVDHVCAWLTKIWEYINDSNVKIPVYLIGHDDYGTITPIKLK